MARKYPQIHILHRIGNKWGVYRNDGPPTQDVLVTYIYTDRPAMSGGDPNPAPYQWRYTEDESGPTFSDPMDAYRAWSKTHRNEE